MTRRYFTSKRKRNTRKNIKRINKYKKGGTIYGSSLELPYIMTYRDITDNSRFLHEVQNPNNTNSYQVGKVYFIKYKDPRDWNYYQYRVKKIYDNGISRYLRVVPVIPKGKKYSSIFPSLYSVSNIEYAYEVLPKNDNNLHYDEQRLALTTPTPTYQTRFKKLPDTATDTIFDYLKRQSIHT